MESGPSPARGLPLPPSPGSTLGRSPFEEEARPAAVRVLGDQEVSRRAHVERPTLVERLGRGDEIEAVHVQGKLMDGMTSTIERGAWEEIASTLKT